MSYNSMSSNEASNHGFLSGFTEASVELPSDKLNGVCVIHYSGRHSHCTMKVKLLNGIRDGDAVILNSGIPYLKLVYGNGTLTGLIERFNQIGTIDLKGQLVNGVESGLFVEYDGDSKIIWRGYYRNGVRYSELTKSNSLDGYYDERSVSSNSLLTTAQYDDSLHDKKGRCFEYENGELRNECVYENGVKICTVRHFINGRMIVFNSSGQKVYDGEFKGDMKNGHGYCLNVNGKDWQYCVYENDQLVRVIQELNASTMTEFDENGRKRYMGEFSGDMRNGFKRNGRGYCLNENEVVEQYCVFENGVMKRVIQSFTGVTMREFHENGMVSYLGEWKGDTTNGFVREGTGKEQGTDGKMTVYSGEWKNGKRDGKGTEYHDGHALYIGEWNKGLRDGSGEEMNENGKVVFVGEWKDGRRNGKGEELSENGASSVGNWKDGKKDGMVYERDETHEIKWGCVFENGEMKRVVQEFSDSTMTEYDENGRRVYEGEYKGDVENGFVRDGYGKEYGLVKLKVKSISKPGKKNWKKRFRWVKESELEVPGVESTSERYREKVIVGYWKDGKKNGMMCELDENESVKRGDWYESDKKKRVGEPWELLLMLLSIRTNTCLIDYTESVSLVVTSIATGKTIGIFQLNRRYYSVTWSKDISLVVMVDMDSKEMIVYRSGKWIDMHCPEEVIDLDSNGRRWEGGVNDGQPFGFGVLYDEEGRKEYEGWIMDGKKTCYGIEYYSDIERVKYEGCYCFNSRFGKGIIYDRNGGIEYDGLWKMDKPYSPQFDGQTIDNHVESICIPNNSFNKSRSFISPVYLHSLKQMVIGDECCGSVNSFELDGLIELESVVIGKKSFTTTKKSEEVRDNIRYDGLCRIVNCPKLKSIQIGSYAFADYRSFELTNLPSLQSIDISGRFLYAPSFSLTDLPQLRSVQLGFAAFENVHSVVFENLPKLQSIELDECALHCDDSRQEKNSVIYKNTLTMRNLPSLTEFKGERNNFRYIGSVILENIPRLSSDGIHIGGIWCFYWTNSILSSSTHSLLSSSFDAAALESFIRNKSEYLKSPSPVSFDH